MRNPMPFLLLCALAACDFRAPADVVEQARTFPLRAEWTASIAPVGGAGTVTGSVNLKEYAGSQIDAEATIAGALPGRAYQWRIFRGSCTATAAADLVLFSTLQAYPDITTDPSGAGKASALLAGALDPGAGYSLRVRLAVAQTNWNGTAPLACGDLQHNK
ncbi:MAG TPA: hypothetical protein VFQ38_12445 [Longimicrobiales bacterium]|nr:hypothetical protein [Longimicrobiales bacterium]